MAKYAENTTVSVEKSKDDVKELITKHGGTIIFMGFREPSGLGVRFCISDFMVDYFIAPNVVDRYKMDQEIRQKWRALFITLKSKFVAIDENLEKVEEAFMAHLLLEEGSGTYLPVTAGNKFLPQIRETKMTYSKSQKTVSSNNSGDTIADFISTAKTG